MATDGVMVVFFSQKSPWKPGGYKMVRERCSMKNTNKTVTVLLEGTSSFHRTSVEQIRWVFGDN